MSNFQSEQLQNDILSQEHDTHSDSDFYADEANINISGYSSNNEIDEDMPGKVYKK